MFVFYLPKSCADTFLVEACLPVAQQCCEGLVGNFHCTARGGGDSTMCHVESCHDTLLRYTDASPLSIDISLCSDFPVDPGDTVVQHLVEMVEDCVKYVELHCSCFLSLKRVFFRHQ